MYVDLGKRRKPPGTPVWVWLLLAFVAAPIAAQVLFGVLLFVGGGSAVLFDRLTGKPMLLEKRVETPSPDGKRRVIVERDGSMCLVDSRTGNIQRKAVLPVQEYTDATVTWRDPDRIDVSARIRYPALAHTSYLVWNVRTGALGLPTDDRDWKTLQDAAP